MASNSSNDGWIWSQEHGKYYRYAVDVSGNYIRDGTGTRAPILLKRKCIEEVIAKVSTLGHYVYIFQDQPSPVHVRTDSVSAYDPNMAPAAPETIRQEIVVRGTPDRGWYETLDNRYRVRTRAEEYQFFKQGRVFATLWTETASETMRSATATENSRATIHNPNPAITQGRFGQEVYSQIRRFVVVRVNRRQHFVLACGITTYGDRGVMKPGCNPSEHTIVYLEGTRPTYLRGEYQRGMTKDPIKIKPTDPAEEMKPASRLRLGKVVSIECNVKVRDIGMVVNEDKSRLLEYYQQEQNNGFEADDDEDDMETPQPAYATIAQGAYPVSQQYHQGYQQYPQ